MAHSAHVLHYGHFGTGVYDDETHTWTFLRYGAAEPAFPFRLVSRSAAGTPAEWALNERSNGSGRGSWKFNSELAPARIFAREEEPVSRALTDAITDYNPNLAERLAFGSARSLLDNDIRSGYATVPIAAYVTGRNGEDLKLVRIGSESVDVSDSNGNDARVSIPCISDQNQAEWSGNGDQIQQICFAATSTNAAAWMAVRLLSSITVFTPLLHRRPVQGRSSRCHPSTPLDANPVLTLPISRTGGHPPADVAWHPLDQQQLAVVDQHGNWSIWQIEGKRSLTSRVLFRMRLLTSAKLYTWDGEGKKPAGVKPYHDGWHRICWLSGPDGAINTILVSNRRSSTVYSTFGRMIQRLDLQLGPLREAQWILDVNTSSTYPGRCFILTSTRLFWFSVRTVDESKEPTRDVLESHLSWRHFRCRGDVTMSLTVLETRQSKPLLIPLTD